ncbi:MAG TPA: aldo/keto reductase [Puia sp.]|nr:aldo/keto reductase [Puia sp.]
MQKRMLGESGIETGPLVFGGNVFGWTINEAQSFRMLDAWLTGGFNMVDTADVYSTWGPGNRGGESETIIGKWMKQRGNRGRVIVATKVGKPMGPDKKGLSAKYMRQALEDSLRRLQTDYIDLYQSHDDDPATPMEETMEAFASFIREGKVRAVGASNFSADRLKKSLEVSDRFGYPRYVSLQPKYNLYERADFERELEPLCVAEGLGVISYYALASGFLTGKYRSEQDLSKSARGQGNKKFLTERGFRILTALDEVANKYHSSPAAVSIAWLIARPSVTAPIASATNTDQLQELVAAASLQLDSEAMGKLGKASEY